MRDLERAHLEVFQPYSNDLDDPKNRRRMAAHVLLGESEKRQEFGAFVGRILAVTQDAYDAPKNRTRFGYSNVSAAQREAIGDEPDRAVEIYKVAVSELDPIWVMEAAPEEIAAVAGIVQTCRELAKLEHQLMRWMNNSD